MRKLIIAAMVATMPVQAFAADWVSVGQNMSGDAFWYDAKGIMRDAKRAVVWVRQTRSNGGYYLSRMFFQCDTQMYRIMALVKYEPNGENESVKTTADMYDVPPDSMYDIISDAVCPASTRAF